MVDVLALVALGLLLVGMVLLGRAAARDQRARRHRPLEPAAERDQRIRQRQEHADLARMMLFGRLSGGGRLAIEEEVDGPDEDDRDDPPGR